MIPRLLTRLHQVSSEGLANPRMEMPRHSDRNPPTRSTPSKTSNGVPLGPPILMVRAHHRHRLLRHQPRLHPQADALAAHWKLASTCARLTFSPHVQRVARNGALTRMPSSFEPSSEFFMHVLW